MNSNSIFAFVFFLVHLLSAANSANSRWSLSASLLCLVSHSSPFHDVLAKADCDRSPTGHFSSWETATLSGVWWISANLSDTVRHGLARKPFKSYFVFEMIPSKLMFKLWTLIGFKNFDRLSFWWIKV